MSSVKYGIQFASALERSKTENKSCLVSRIHSTWGEQTWTYFTLHQIVWKILRRKHKANIVEKLAGDEMEVYVKEALRLTFSTEPNERLIKYYIYAIRSHKNNLDILNSLPNGPAILANYQKLLKDNFDWEDSFQTATWYLKNNRVTSLYEFSYQNIILVHPELLNQSRNKNADDFFNAWCTWMEEYTRCNAFIVNDFGYIYKFKNGAFKSEGHIDHYLYLNEETPFDYTGYYTHITPTGQQQPSNEDGCFF